MKRIVKFFSLVLTLAMIFSLAGCLPAPTTSQGDGETVNEGVDFTTPMDESEREKTTLEV